MMHWTREIWWTGGEDRLPSEIPYLEHEAGLGVADQFFERAESMLARLAGHGRGTRYPWRGEGGSAGASHSRR